MHSQVFTAWGKIPEANFLTGENVNVLDPRIVLVSGSIGVKIASVTLYGRAVDKIFFNRITLHFEGALLNVPVFVLYIDINFKRFTRG